MKAIYRLLAGTFAAVTALCTLHPFPSGVFAEEEWQRWNYSVNIETYFDEQTKTAYFRGTGAIPDNKSIHHSSATETKTEHIVIGEGITGIGEYVFNNYKLLKTAELPSTLTTIGQYAFSGSALEKVNFPESLTEIGYCAFQNTAITQLDLAVPKVGDCAFSKCAQLRTVVIEPECELGSGIFSGCTALQSVTVAEGREQMLLSSIGSGLAEDAVVTIPKSMHYLCFNCRIPRLVVLNPRCDTKGTSSGNLEQYPKSGDGPFPDSVIIGYPYSIAQHVADQRWKCKFEPLGQIPTGDGYLRRFGSCGENAQYKFYYDGTLVITGTGAIDAHAFEDFGDNKLPGYGGLIPSREPRLYYVYISEGITEIGEDAFKDDFYLEDVHFPSTMRIIGEYAFRDCLKLQQIALGSGTEFVGGHAFSGCKSVRKIVLNEGLKYIMSDAFSSCFEYEESPDPIIFPKSLEYCGNEAFDGQPETVYFLNPHTIMNDKPFSDNSKLHAYGYAESLDGDFVTVLPDALSALLNGRNRNSYAVGITAREPRGYAFHYCRSYTIIGSESEIPAVTPDPVQHRYFEEQVIVPYTVPAAPAVTTTKATTTTTTTTTATTTTTTTTAAVSTTTTIFTNNFYPQRRLGDVNGDYSIDIRDAVLLCRYLTEDGSLRDEGVQSIETVYADMDCDGKLTVLDVTVLLKYLVFLRKTAE